MGKEEGEKYMNNRSEGREEDEQGGGLERECVCVGAEWVRQRENEPDVQWQTWSESPKLPNHLCTSLAHGQIYLSD